MPKNSNELIMHRLDLLARRLDVAPTDHPASAKVVLGDDASEENYPLDAVLEAMGRRLAAVERRVDTPALAAVQDYVAAAFQWPPPPYDTAIQRKGSDMAKKPMPMPMKKGKHGKRGC